MTVANLRQRGASKTLSSTVSSLFQKQLSEQELAELLRDLKRQGVVIVHENKVCYALPQGSEAA